MSHTTHRSASAISRRHRLTAMALLVLSMVGGLVLVDAAQPDRVLGTFPAHLSKFKISTISDQVAGASFQVKVEAQDRYGNKIKTYPGTAVVLSGLAPSPGGTAPTYGLGSWSQGVGTYAVTAYQAAASSITAADSAKGVSKTSNTFAVSPGAPTLAFTAQPVDAQVGVAISSSLTSTSPITVRAADSYGNTIGSLSVTMSTSVALAGTVVVATAANGTAAFADLAIGSTGTYQLTATAGSASAVSDPFTVVDDLQVCDGTTCGSTAAFTGPGGNQAATSTITTAGDFDNTVVLTTTFGDPTTGAGCVDDGAVFGQTTEVRVDGAGVSATAPSFRTILIYPRETLEALGFKYRLADSFNLCVGAVWLGDPDDVDPWRAKRTSTSLKFADAVPDADGTYWGWAASCLFVSSSDPCIVVRSRTVLELKLALGMTSAQVAALGFETGDLAIVVRKPWPWDGKFTAK